MRDMFLKRVAVTEKNVFLFGENGVNLQSGFKKSGT